MIMMIFAQIVLTISINMIKRINRRIHQLFMPNDRHPKSYFQFAIISLNLVQHLYQNHYCLSFYKHNKMVWMMFT